MKQDVILRTTETILMGGCPTPCLDMYGLSLREPEQSIGYGWLLWVSGEPSKARWILTLNNTEPPHGLRDWALSLWREGCRGAIENHLIPKSWYQAEDISRIWHLPFLPHIQQTRRATKVWLQRLHDSR